MTAILVTGGAGYIGSHFVRLCMQRFPDIRIIVADNLSEGHPEALPISPRVHLERTDIGDIESVSRLLKQNQVGAVVHFAASCYVGESEKDPGKYFHNNVINSLNLFQSMES